MEIIRTRTYAKQARRLLDEHEQRIAEDDIARAPQAWPVITGTGGVWKARAARGNAGKSGGVRIIYYYMAQDGRIYLLDLYAKNAQGDITAASKKILRETVKLLKGAPHG